ncbi:hypothetical protein DICSQDRAFT_123313 [Dichomitus squalens LYAD-421 SS1]|uniref:Uncharacterized protein n=1 Tax=Dichomitus squalens TaxID=114155 RepID=A0A4V2K250_9APHY|nr:uncharacterized protein DICSQDRAFT_123313 [Dichomitus squalens LYAD-421 SS1]EJF66727.1 hypothetical protein DICSQDRAFT_123313 [Dichomitus squalens LYAD-421 SS1]TBU35283.1 hypothetical protein BD311DRAFT_745891 [Dichomitus squalens]TBU65112.1 hypothetical protein BD310DRAFT_302677 [Dichomitus squalens]
MSAALVLNEPTGQNPISSTPAALDSATARGVHDSPSSSSPAAEHVPPSTEKVAVAAAADSLSRPSDTDAQEGIAITGDDDKKDDDDDGDDWFPKGPPIRPTAHGTGGGGGVPKGVKG